MSNLPARPVSPERRNITIDALSALFASGRLELDDFESRVDRAIKAESVEELDSLVVDLKPGSEARKEALPAVRTGEIVPAAPRRRGDFLTFAIMGGVEQKGRWLPARHHFGIGLMGGVVIDFREADLPPGPTHVYLLATMGYAGAAVPPGLDVETHGFAVMGGLERVSQESGIADAKRPRLIIHALAVMGGIEVKVLEPGAPFEGEAKEEADED